MVPGPSAGGVLYGRSSFPDGLAGRGSPALWGEDAESPQGGPSLRAGAEGARDATAACEVSARGQRRAGETSPRGVSSRVRGGPGRGGSGLEAREEAARELPLRGA